MNASKSSKSYRPYDNMVDATHENTQQIPLMQDIWQEVKRPTSKLARTQSEFKLCFLKISTTSTPLHKNYWNKALNSLKSSNIHNTHNTHNTVINLSCCLRLSFKFTHPHQPIQPNKPQQGTRYVPSWHVPSRRPWIVVPSRNSASPFCHQKRSTTNVHRPRGRNSAPGWSEPSWYFQGAQTKTGEGWQKIIKLGNWLTFLLEKLWTIPYILLRIHNFVFSKSLVNGWNHHFRKYSANIMCKIELEISWNAYRLVTLWNIVENQRNLWNTHPQHALQSSTGWLYFQVSRWQVSASSGSPIDSSK